jgi:hypothetical protein
MGSLADLAMILNEVRFTPMKRHHGALTLGPKSARNGSRGLGLLDQIAGAARRAGALFR